MASHPTTDTNGEAFDVIIVGAGISGINCAYRLRTELPHLKLLILEGRESIGGTWDLFRYPGVRSDSDIYTMGFAWHPWSFDYPIATGNQIMEYLTDAVSKHQLDKFIKFQHQVLSADWSSTQKSWTLSVRLLAQHSSPSQTFKSRWIILGTGYYDFESPLQPEIPGLGSFKGRIIHPQFWPTDFDHTNKNIAVIGSGATAVSLLPALPDRAAQVTMIQRSPTYVAASPNTAWAQQYFPKYLVDTYRRVRYLISPYLLVLLCKSFPSVVRDALRKDSMNLLPKHVDVDVHFKPRYNPWDQRICLDPDAVFYKALHLPNVKLITGEIESVTDNAIKMKDNQIVATDVLITATGFRMTMGGKIDLRVNGNPISWRKRYIWNGAMLDSVPNMMFMLGYTNHAWTVGADNTAVLLTRLLKYMEKGKMTSAEARVPPEAATDSQRMWQLDSTYVLAADGDLPVYGMKGNWQPRNRPPFDYVHARLGNFTSDLHVSA